MSCLSSRLRRRALREHMNFKELLDYGRGLEMSEKQAKTMEEQDKLAQVADVQTVKDRRKSENLKIRSVTGVEKTTLTKDDLVLH